MNLIFGIQPRRFWSGITIALTAMVLLCGYEFVRSTAQSIFISYYGANRLPYAMAFIPIMAILVVYAYGWLLSLFGARRALMISSLFCALLFVITSQALARGYKPVAVFLYLFKEVYITLFVEQLWAFINSTLRTEDAKKLNGPICGIASLGALSGGYLVGALSVRLGSINLIYFTVVSLLITTFSGSLFYRLGGEPQPELPDEKLQKDHFGLQALLKERKLLYLALAVMCVQATTMVLDIYLSHHVVSSIQTVDLRTRWFGLFYGTLQAASSVFQFVVAPLVLLYFTPRIIHIIMSLVSVICIVLSVFFPSLLVVASALFVVKLFDYSIFRAVKEMVYIPFSFDVRYRAKQLIDVFGCRSAKGVVSVVLSIAVPLIHMPIVGYAGVALGLVGGWLFGAVKLTGSVKREAGDLKRFTNNAFL